MDADLSQQTYASSGHEHLHDMDHTHQQSYPSSGHEQHPHDMNALSYPHSDRPTSTGHTIYYTPSQSAHTTGPMLLSNSFAPQPDYSDEYGHALVENVSFGHSSSSHSPPDSFTYPAAAAYGVSAHPHTSPSALSITPPSTALHMAVSTPPLPPHMDLRYVGHPISPSGSMSRHQKPKRTALACEECRKKKQKCDGVTPCQSCKEQKLECKYRDVNPTKKDNTLEKVIALVQSFGPKINLLHERLEAANSTLRKIEKYLVRCRQCGSNVEPETGNCHSCNTLPCRL